MGSNTQIRGWHVSPAHACVTHVVIKIDYILGSVIGCTAHLILHDALYGLIDTGFFLDDSRCDVFETWV
jgi:hypothetical protein